MINRHIIDLSHCTTLICCIIIFVFIKCLSENCNVTKIIDRYIRNNDLMRESASRIISPSPTLSLEAQEIDELVDNMKHSDIELIQISKTNSPSSLTIVNFDLIDIQVGNFGATYISNGTTDTEHTGLMYKLKLDTQTVCNGYNISSKDFMLYNKNSEHMAMNNNSCNWAYITFKSDYLEDTLIDCLEIDLDTRPGQCVCLQSGHQKNLDSLNMIINEVAGLAQSNPELLRDPDILKAMEVSLLTSQAVLLENALNPRTGSRDKANKSHELIIKGALEYLKSNSYNPIHVLDLCKVLNVKMRTLFYAFQEFYGISPVRYLRLLRYAKARRDLLNSNPKKTSVTDIAAKWHFWHFGRFSVDYKRLYGESPSESLYKM